MNENMQSLRAEREKLAEALANCERGAFPGSRAAREESRALRALAQFDAEHPEVIREIRRERDVALLAGKDEGGM